MSTNVFVHSLLHSCRFCRSKYVACFIDLLTVSGLEKLTALLWRSRTNNARKLFIFIFFLICVCGNTGLAKKNCTLRQSAITFFCTEITILNFYHFFTTIYCVAV